MWRFGSFVLAEMLLGWLLVWFDNVAVARNLGPEAAGIYSLAFSIAFMTISLPCSAITGVTLPTLSRLQGEPEALRATFLRGLGLIAAYALPAGIGLALLGPPALGILYPDRWNRLAPVLAVLALYCGVCSSLDLGH